MEQCKESDPLERHGRADKLYFKVEELTGEMKRRKLISRLKQNEDIMIRPHEDIGNYV